MSLLAPTLQAFFTQRLSEQLRASPNTIASYRDTFRLLLRFAQQRTRKAPSKLELSDLDAALIGAFLEHLESARGNSVRTRNARLAAIHSLFRFAALRHPDHAALIQRVLAIPDKRSDRATVSFLNRDGARFFPLRRLTTAGVTPSHCCVAGSTRNGGDARTPG